MKDRFALLAALLIGVVLLVGIADQKTDSSLPDYQTWKTQFGAKAGIRGSDDAYRKAVYQKNLEKIRKHNSRDDVGYKMGVNRFTALTESEFLETYLSPVSGNPRKLSPKVQHLTKRVEEVDWVSKGSVSPVKDQGSCRSAYAFATAGAIQSAASIEYIQQIWYSAQQFVDCTGYYGNQGCVTGNIVNSLYYARNRGMMTEFGYPYKGYVQKCQDEKATYRIKAYDDINSCDAMDQFIAKRPVASAVDASNFQNYVSGIFSDCGVNNVNLPVLIVGMSDDYYKLKLSWGTQFGEGGYMRIKKKENICGICFFPTDVKA